MKKFCIINFTTINFITKDSLRAGLTTKYNLIEYLETIITTIVLLNTQKYCITKIR